MISLTNAGRAVYGCGNPRHIFAQQFVNNITNLFEKDAK